VILGLNRRHITWRGKLEEQAKGDVNTRRLTSELREEGVTYIGPEGVIVGGFVRSQ